MIINVGNHEFSEVWDGVFYKALSDYPNVCDNEMKDIIDFIAYERANGRTAEIVSDNPKIKDYVLQEAQKPEKYVHTKRPSVIRECTACPVRKGCMTDFVCHTAPVENAVKILRCGFLLSAVRARGLSAEVLMKEPRNAAHDPKDFFDYVMFSWGNCQAGDRLVMERQLGRSPTAEEMGVGFIPGVRFYFRYDELDRHPQAVHDGFLPIKVKNEVELNKYVFAVIVPELHRKRIAEYVPAQLLQRTHYLDSSNLDVWEWSEKVYSYVCGITC